MKNKKVKKENKKQVIKVEITPIKVKVLKLNIVGKGPLMMDRFGIYAQKEMIQYQEGNKKKDKAKSLEKIDPELKFQDKIHRMPNGKVGFPTSGFSKGMAASVVRFGVSTQVISGQMIADSISFIKPMIEIKYKKMEKHEDWIRLKRGDSRVHVIRPLFYDWNCKVAISYNANVLNPETIIAVLNEAGFHKSLGTWGARKGGPCGEYEVKLK